MCLVTDAPGPVTTLVFEHIEDGEEIQVSRRDASKQRRLRARIAPQPAQAALLTPSRPALRPRPAGGPAAHDHVRKVPSPVPEPALSSSEDH